MNQSRLCEPDKLIKYKVNLMVLVVIMLSLLSFGLTYWQEKRQAEVEQGMHMYHMASVHDIIMIEKEIQGFRLQELNRSNKEIPAGVKSRPDVAYELRRLLDVIVRRQQRYEDKTFNVALEKMHSGVVGIISLLNKKENVQPNRGEQIMEHIQPLMFSLEQMQRLHMISYHELLGDYESGKLTGLQFLLSIALIISVLIVAYYALRAIR